MKSWLRHCPSTGWKPWRKHTTLTPARGLNSSFLEVPSFTTGLTNRAYFSVYYYTKSVLLKAGCAPLKGKCATLNSYIRSQKYKLYITLCKTAANPLKITVLNIKTSSASPLTSHRGAPTTGPPLGAPPPDPRYRLAPPLSPCVYY